MGGVEFIQPGDKGWKLGAPLVLLPEIDVFERAGKPDTADGQRGYRRRRVGHCRKATSDLAALEIQPGLIGCLVRAITTLIGHQKGPFENAVGERGLAQGR